MKRHKSLTFRKPENTNLFRANAFYKTKVIELSDNYEPELKPWEFTADRVYNIYETGVSTVIRTPNILAHLGTKQVG
jgi:hypothetical protein